MVEFYGKLVGKYTSPMDPMKCWLMEPKHANRQYRVHESVGGQ